MSKIYTGKRGCGKTTRLLRQAEAMEDAGKIPVFIVGSKGEEKNLRWFATEKGIDASKWKFELARDLQVLPRGERYCYFIDEAQYVMAVTLNTSNLFVTISEEECKRLERADFEDDDIAAYVDEMNRR